MTSNGTTDSNFGSHSHDKAIVPFTEGSAGIKENEGTYEHTLAHTYVVFTFHYTHIQGRTDGGAQLVPRWAR